MGRPGRLTGRRRLLRRVGGAVAAFAVAAAAAAHAQTAGPVGTYDLSLEGSHRRCRMVLGAEPSGTARAVRFPATCRRALPFLGAVAGWSATDEGVVILLDQSGQPSLVFKTARDGEGLTARSTSGETYRLVAVDRPREARRPPPAQAGAPQPRPVDPATAPPFSALPGTYAVDRYTERDVCRVALSPTMLDASGRYEARLLEGCRDGGMAVFDPVAWRYDGGRLRLIARRGHEVALVSERDGLWRRDPEVGTTLVLRKAAP